MMRRHLFIPLLALALPAAASNENLPVGARSGGMAHSSITLSDQWSVFHNQAGLGRINAFSAGFFYESRFMISSLSTGALAVAAPVKNGALGLSVYSFGLNNYRESKVGLAYGRMLGEKISVGMQMNYHSTVLPEAYGRFSGLTGEIGLQARLTDEIILGAHIFNVSRTKLDDKNTPEYIPTIIRIGLQYTVSEKVLITSEFQKDIEHPVMFKAATEYCPNDKLFLRLGIASNPGIYAFGFGYRWNSITADISAAYHQVLGFTPQIALNWKIRETAENKGSW